MRTGPISAQQEAFIRAVVRGLDYTAAYCEAYNPPPTTKRPYLNIRASKIANLPHVAARIRELRDRMAINSMAEASTVLREVARVATSDIRKIFNEAGNVKFPHELDDDTAAAVSSFKIDEYGRVEYKFWDKNVALEKCINILGLYEADNRQKSDPLSELMSALSGNVAGVVRDITPDDDHQDEAGQPSIEFDDEDDNADH